jgi:uncharacterized protein
MRKFRKLGAAAVAAILCLAQSASASPDDLVAQMDTSAPNYQTPGCQDARTKAAAYDSDVGGRIALGVALGATLGILGFPLAAAADKSKSNEARDLVNNLIAQCGADAFIPYFKAKAMDGDANAQAWLGQTYAAGTTGKQNWSEALHWYGIAAGNGNIAAEVNLGAMYYRGNGVPQDFGEAEKLWQKAADDGSPEGQTNLASLYIEGHGVAQDYEEARHILRHAARQGFGHAQFMIGDMFEKGLGVTQNNIVAYKWYAVATAVGYAPAQAARDRIAASLDPREVAIANRAVRDCKELQYRDCTF